MSVGRLVSDGLDHARRMQSIGRYAGYSGIWKLSPAVLPPKPFINAAVPVARPGSTKSAFPTIVVLIGSGRSGSVYLSGLLKQSWDINFSGEPKFVVPLSQVVERFGDLRNDENLRSLVCWIHTNTRPFEHLHKAIKVPSQPDEILDRLLEPTYTGVLYAVFQLLADKRERSRLGYRDPADIKYIPEVARLLPTAKFVHIIRDGRDVARSFTKFNWGPTNLYVGAREWTRGVSKARQDGLELGADRYFELRLEDLIRDPESVAKPLGEFVRADPELHGKFLENVRATGNVDSIEVWKREMTLRDRGLCEAVAGEVLEACGYEVSGAPVEVVNPRRRVTYIATDIFARTARSAARRF